MSSTNVPPIALKTWREKVGLAEMLKGGVIMDVINVEQAKIAEDAGAVAVMALERVPADIRRDGGVARMSDPEMILEIKQAVSIPVMAKCRIGHFVEAEILESLEVDFVDESEVLTPADEANHVNKHAFTVPFVCGAKNLGEALRRCAEGAAMIRTKGEAGTGDVGEAVRHMRTIMSEIRQVRSAREDELFVLAKNHQASYDLIREVHELGQLPVPNFSAGGIATPADAALMMKLGAQTVFVGSGIFKASASLDGSARLQAQQRRASAIVASVLYYKDPKKLAEISSGLGEAMVGINCSELPGSQRMADRGW
jgi:pyridoxal 5'-phosphate synthase pdxS subunit